MISIREINKASVDTNREVFLVNVGTETAAILKKAGIHSSKRNDTTFTFTHYNRSTIKDMWFCPILPGYTDAGAIAITMKGYEITFSSLGNNDSTAYLNTEAKKAILSIIHAINMNYHNKIAIKWISSIRDNAHKQPHACRTCSFIPNWKAAKILQKYNILGTYDGNTENIITGEIAVCIVTKSSEDISVLFAGVDEHLNKQTLRIDKKDNEYKIHQTMPIGDDRFTKRIFKADKSDKLIALTDILLDEMNNK